MSGSPIIQDGKVIGAVTHVFIQDPAKGYGIFIENMHLKNRGEKDVLFFCVDGLPGFKEAIQAIYPQAQI